MNRGDSDPAIVFDVGIKGRGAGTRAPASHGGREAAERNKGPVAIGALIPGALERLAAAMEQRRYGQCDDKEPPGAHLVPLSGAGVNEAGDQQAGDDAHHEPCDEDFEREGQHCYLLPELEGESKCPIGWMPLPRHMPSVARRWSLSFPGCWRSKACSVRARSNCLDIPLSLALTKPENRKSFPQKSSRGSKRGANTSKKCGGASCALPRPHAEASVIDALDARAGFGRCALGPWFAGAGHAALLSGGISSLMSNSTECRSEAAAISAHRSTGIDLRSHQPCTVV